ncbi:hypothetical protein H9P43_003713 [Blastocladiella emersonii ATCC 22665]|nr:hypothetical protein H9P43_003713 [Blastocladiella emersonii ATCC 22665]
MTPTPHYDALAAAVAQKQAADLASDPLRDRLTDLKREWLRLAILNHHVARAGAGGGRGNTGGEVTDADLRAHPAAAVYAGLPVLYQAAALGRERESVSVADVERAIKGHFLRVLEHGRGQEIATDLVVPQHAQHLLADLRRPTSSLSTPPASASAFAASSALAAATQCLDHLHSLVAAHAARCASRGSATPYYSLIILLARRKLALLSSRARADAWTRDPAVQHLARAVAAALAHRVRVLRETDRRCARALAAYELGDEFKAAVAELARVRGRIREEERDVRRLRGGKH